MSKNVINEVTVFELSNYEDKNSPFRGTYIHFYYQPIDEAYSQITGEEAISRIDIPHRGIVHVHNLPIDESYTCKLNFHDLDLLANIDYCLLLECRYEPIMISFNSDNYSSIDELIKRTELVKIPLQMRHDASFIIYDYGKKGNIQKEILIQELKNYDGPKTTRRIDVVTSTKELSASIFSLNKAAIAAQEAKKQTQQLIVTRMAESEPSFLSRVGGLTFGMIIGFGGGFTAGIVRPRFKLFPVSNIFCAVLGAMAGVFRGAYLGAKHGVMPRFGKDAPIFHMHDILSRRTINIPCADNSKVEYNRARLFNEYLMFREQHRNLLATIENEENVDAKYIEL